MEAAKSTKGKKRKVRQTKGKNEQADCRKMAEDGYCFFLSADGVWLTGKVPAGYLRRLEK